MVQIQQSLAHWKRWLQEHRYPSITAVIRSDLYDFLTAFQGDVVYMDFAWPWRDGRGTSEYTVMADMVSSTLLQQPISYETWTGANVLDRVHHALELALRSSRYVILSNQSSNYPTADVLEDSIAQWKSPLMAMRRLTLPAEDVDNRGLDDWFTEYQYIFRGYR